MQTIWTTHSINCPGEQLSWGDFGDLFILYVYIHITRGLVMALFFPLLRKMGYGLTWKEASVCVFGGLRGAVGVAMALLVKGNAKDDCRIGFQICGIVFLTLAVNGQTIVDFYKWLKVYKVVDEETQKKFLLESFRHLDTDVTHMMDHCKESWQFHNCEWDIIQSFIPK